MRAWKITAVLLALASASVPQELPPEVVLLARIKAHMRDELSRLPNYTCLETINRFHRASSGASLKPLDTVRLEVVYSDHREWYGSPGARDLGVSDPVSFIGSGLMDSGVFATALNNILNGAQFVYQGKESRNGRTAVRYDFQFTRRPDAFEISMVGGEGTVGEKGSLWVDEQSLDMIRLETAADDIPAYLPLAEQSTAVNYARMKIGGATALLAQQADVRLVESAGVENYDHFEFTNCREYSTESTISFGGESPQAPVEGAKSAAPAASYALPALLKVTVQLAGPISSSDAVGTIIEGRVVGDVVYKRKIVIPNGALVHGRIRRLEHYQGKARGNYIVGLEFGDVETSSGNAPFYADLLSMDPRPEVQPNLAELVPVGKVKITLPELPGVASFFVTGSSFTLPAGFKTVWRTRGPIRGIEQR